MGDTMTVAAGIGLLLLGATGATLVQRGARGRPAPPSVARLVPFGVLIGAGAALVRGWDLAATILAAAVLVPAVGFLGALRAARRHRH